MPTADGSALLIAYSVNKEDIAVTRVPLTSLKPPQREQV